MANELSQSPRVEVILADGAHQIIRTRDSSININQETDEMNGGANMGRTPLNVADCRVRMPNPAQAASAPNSISNPLDYPLLAEQMKVRGSVVLETRIGKDGNIRDMQVLSGPEILAAAAQEAVKRWRFRPHIQGGQEVEAQSRITVNFLISTH